MMDLKITKMSTICNDQFPQIFWVYLTDIEFSDYGDGCDIIKLLKV